MNTSRREIIGAGLGLLGARAIVAQQSTASAGPDSSNQSPRAAQPKPPVLQGKITKLFKSPEGYPNAMAAAPEGWWLGEQKSDHACLVDWDGKLLKTVKTEAKNTSGIAFGGGYVWMCANAEPNGIYQTDVNSKTISHRQIPLG